MSLGGEQPAEEKVFVKAIAERFGTSDFASVTTLDISEMTVPSSVDLYDLGFTNATTLVARNTVFADSNGVVYCPSTICNMPLTDIDLSGAKFSGVEYVIRACCSAEKGKVTINLSNCPNEDFWLPDNQCIFNLTISKAPSININVHEGGVNRQSSINIVPVSGGTLKIYFKQPVDLRRWVIYSYSQHHEDVQLYILTGNGYMRVNNVSDETEATLEAINLIEANQ